MKYLQGEWNLHEYQVRHLFLDLGQPCVCIWSEVQRHSIHTAHHTRKASHGNGRLRVKIKSVGISTRIDVVPAAPIIGICWLDVVGGGRFRAAPRLKIAAAGSGGQRVVVQSAGYCTSYD